MVQGISIFVVNDGGIIVLTNRDPARDPLDSTSASQPPDGGLGDALDVVTEDPPVPLGTSLPQSLASFATSRHVYCSAVVLRIIKIDENSIYLYSNRVRAIT